MSGGFDHSFIDAIGRWMRRWLIAASFFAAVLAIAIAIVAAWQPA